MSPPKKDKPELDALPFFCPIRLFCSFLLWNWALLFFPLPPPPPRSGQAKSRNPDTNMLFSSKRNQIVEIVELFFLPLSAIVYFVTLPPPSPGGGYRNLQSKSKNRLEFQYRRSFCETREIASGQLACVRQKNQERGL